MRTLLIHFCLGLILVLSGCSAQAQALPEQEQPTKAKPTSPETVTLLEEIENSSAKIDTLKARVRYTREQTLTGDIQKRFGDFYYQAQTEKSPTRFAVLFDRLMLGSQKTARELKTWYIFDGNWLLERDHDSKQATRREMVPKGAEREGELSLGDGRLPIPLKLKAAEMLKRYEIERQPDVESEKRLCHHLIFTPKNAREDDAPLELWFDVKTKLLYKLVTEQDGDMIELVLPTPEVNPKIAPAIFKTKLPEEKDGWQVQEVPIER